MAEWSWVHEPFTFWGGHKFLLVGILLDRCSRTQRYQEAILLQFTEEMLRTGAQLVEDRAVVREVVSLTPAEPTLRVLTL